MTDHDDDTFMDDFKSAGGWVDLETFGLKTFEGMGTGAVALKDMAANTALFHVPLTLILSTYTSDLRSQISETEWESLGGGWARLILVMMWETERGEHSKWGTYLKSMPTSFDTPMFWSEEQLQQLVGTDIENRIGKTEAEIEYREKVMPVLKANPELFPLSSPNFSLSAFHVQGSRILSRSFTILEQRAGPLSLASPSITHDSDGDNESDDDEEDDDDEGIAVMIPMADKLNAEYERDNARLFRDYDDGRCVEDRQTTVAKGYTMVTTRDIKAGDQILNTYASPPNSELLRKYGHVDAHLLDPKILSLLSEDEIGAWPYGNPGDEVQIAGDKIVHAMTSCSAIRNGSANWESSVKHRVDCWLEDGQDDTFSLSISETIDSSMVAFMRILLCDFEWHRFERKGKLPETIVDADVSAVCKAVISERLARYSGSLELDLQTILTQPPLPTYMRTSAMVRLGERRILHLASRVIDTRRHTGGHPSDLPVAKRKFDAGDNENKGRNATAGILFRDRP